MAFNKLIIFDINLDWNKYDENDKRYKDLSLIWALYKQAVEHQTVVIQSSGWFQDCIDYIDQTRIKKGYLIANAGAIIYDIAKQKIIEVNPIKSEEVKAIVHHGIMLNINMVISTPKQKYVFVSDEVSYKRIENSLYSKPKWIESYEQLDKIINKDDIVDIAYITPFETGKNEVQRQFQYNIERYFDNEVNDIVIKANQSSPFVHFSSAKSKKLKALQQVMALANIEHLNDIMYIACTCINRECYLYFKNTLIANNPDFLVEIAGAKPPKYISNEINNLNIDFGKETNSFWK